MQWYETGNCTMCGASEVKVLVVDEETSSCERCLDTYFFVCDGCGEYWLDEPHIRFDTGDDKSLCPWCADK